jgi:hypothetical protein
VRGLTLRLPQEGPRAFPKPSSKSTVIDPGLNVAAFSSRTCLP